MGRKALSMSEKIRRYIEAHPKAKPSEIALTLNVKPSLVYAVRYSKVAKADKPRVTSMPEVLVRAADPIVSTPKPVTVTVTAHDIVSNPAHYTDGGIETINFIQAKLTPEEFIGYLKGNALKYGSRIGKKGDPTVDAGKMAWYTSKLVATLTATPR